MCCGSVLTALALWSSARNAVTTAQLCRVSKIKPAATERPSFDGCVHAAGDQARKM